MLMTEGTALLDVPLPRCFDSIKHVVDITEGECAGPSGLASTHSNAFNCTCIP